MIELDRVVFVNGSWGMAQDGGSNNTSILKAAEKTSLVVDEELRCVLVSQVTRDGTLTDYLVPFESVCQMHVKQKPQQKLREAK